MTERIDVFISSTARDLVPYRDAVVNVILRTGFYPIIMETFNPTDRNALQLCYDKVQEAEIFVGIYAYRYGYTPSADVTYKTVDGQTLTGDGETGITSLEYLWALERNIPILLFTVGEQDAEGNPLAWPVSLVEDEPGKTHLKNFKKIITDKHVVGFFHSPDHLAMQVSTALNEIVREIDRKQREQLIDDIKAERDRLVLRAESRQQIHKRNVVGERLGNTTRFLDRIKEQKRICQLLMSQGTRIVSIISRGGMGKTALATKVLGYFEDKRVPFIDSPVTNDGIIYLSTRSSTSVSLERVFLSFGQILDKESEVAGLWNSSTLTLREKIERLLDLFYEGHYILMLDNLEDVMDTDGTLTDHELRTFLEVVAVSTRTIQILITSRIALTSPVEITRVNHEIPLLEGLPEQEGISLLRALDVNGDFGLREAQDTILGKAVAMVNGVPRALEVISSILANDPILMLDELLTREEIFHHPNFVERLVEENYGYIDANTRHVLESLAVYGCPVPEVAINHMVSTFIQGTAPRNILAQLVKTHVISADRTTRTYHLHPIDADYLYNQLTPTGDYSRQSLNQLATEYYAQLCLPFDKWHSLDDLEPHFRQYDHALRAENYNFAAIALNEVSEQLNNWGYSQRNTQMLLDLEGRITDTLQQAQFQINLGYVYVLKNKAPEAVASFNQAIALTIDKIDKIWLKIHYEALVGIGTAYRKTGRYKEASDYFKMAIDFKQHQPLLSDQIEPLSALGLGFLDLGDGKLALAYITRALQEAQGHNDLPEIVFANFYLGIVYSIGGEWDKAITFHQQAIEMADQINRVRQRGFCRIELARTFIRAGRLEPVEPILRVAQTIAEEIQSPEHVQYTQYLFTLYFLRMGRLNEAFERIQSAAKINTHWLDFEIALLEGILMARLSDVEAAQKAFEHTLNLIKLLSPEYFYVDYVHFLTYVGLALVIPKKQSEWLQKAQMALENAIQKSAPLGSIAEVTWLLSELAPLDTDGVLTHFQERLAEVSSQA